jgi:putative GTP pyrophosphokinase
MSLVVLSADEHSLLDAILSRYRGEFDRVTLFGAQIRLIADTQPLAGLIHSVKVRVKAPDHLYDKLLRKLSASRDAGEDAFSITPENFFERINDLVGLRLLHLHTAQFADINAALLEQFDELGYRVMEGPVAYVWDDEYQKLFKSFGVETRQNERMYTSVHYVVEANTRTKRTAEIQVRTLAEELWGEVDHLINYPHESEIFTCREQIKVLARVTSSCTRLVDSIFRSREDHVDAHAPERAADEWSSETPPDLPR